MAIQNYNSPIFIQWNTDSTGRKISIAINNEQHQIANMQITLNQIPDFFYKVKIDNMYEIKAGIPNDNEFRVDYNTGIVSFNISNEAKVITIKQYWGRGIILYPASRIYDSLEGQPIDITKTLQDFINSVKQYQFDNWSTDKIYTPNKIVSYNGSTFICIKQTLNHEVPTNTEYWSVLATGFNWKENYNNEIQYELRDVVYYEKQKTIYYCIKRCKDVLPTNIEYWQPMISVLAETTYAIQQGDYAKEQGNYAKQEGDNLNNTINQFNYIGEYDGNVNYLPKNMVKYHGSTYVNKVACKGILPEDTTYWQIIAVGYILRGDYKDTNIYYPRDIVFYSMTNKLYECIKETIVGTIPTNTEYWIEKIDISNLVKLINDYTNDITSLYIAHDVGVEITHNLNDYITCHCVAINGGGYGHGGYGGVFGYGESPAYEVKSRIMYDVTDPKNKIKIFLDEGFIGIPAITQINTKIYDISFSEDVASLRVFLKTNG